MKFAILLAAATSTRAGAFPSFLRSHRSLVTEQCLAETGAYSEAATMATAYGAVESEIEDMAACSAVIDKASCEVDFATFDSAEEFVQSCAALGGKTIKLDANINCSYDAPQIGRMEGSPTSGFTFTYHNLLDCVSPQCEDSSVQDKVKGAIETATNDVAKRTRATCTYTVDGFASSAASEGTPVTDILVEDDSSSTSDGAGSEPVEKDTSSAQCRSLMAAAIGAPLLALAV